MDNTWCMNFRLTLWKGIVSIIIGLVIDYLISSSTTCLLYPGGGRCPSTIDYMFGFTGIATLIIGTLVVYIIWSFIQKKQ